MNALYYGDNLDILRRYVADESVDLIYLDPPFKSNQDYNVLFAEQDGSRSTAQIKAFGDTWRWDQSAARAYQEIVETGGKVSQVMQAFRTFLGESDMLAYLSMMAPRLKELHRVLKSNGSIYLHCDSAASHYLKMLMDAVYGPQQFRNEIIWKRTAAHNDPNRCGNIHDSILFYTKSDAWLWNVQYQTYTDEFLSRFKHTDPDGRQWYDDNITFAGETKGDYTWKGKRPPSGRHWAFVKDTMERLEREGKIFYTKSGMPRLKRYLDEAQAYHFKQFGVTFHRSTLRPPNA